ncbi:MULTISPECIES: hypothetical protein [Methylococcus]|jgi:hypothetical protein|uniref:Uncharacterized protein n=1 Tax=Methylococcus capsulatus TaxID=414 RepID=A0AA35UUR8_METCP|nr:hypothetical protein [Methylococcus capsulatus]QXP86649.1 hypothetical protein KW112_09575 [Methylococcus capsulatus]QXP92024.1 hypothetical protein KW114_07850 [Methylococcus capsulatus]QXP93673.1 hypothetical protein KW113_00045 [Methylococcus capsulatus]UQN11613.1 hypothetical protein M3M30_11320 [Methylococcus capsulatus]CAI8806267.1 protein of unknown function [Methylococcus capsulatus]
MADHHHASELEHGTAGRKAAAVVFIVGITALIVALDRLGVFGPGHEGGEERTEQTAERAGRPPVTEPSVRQDEQAPLAGEGSEAPLPVFVTGNYSGSEIRTAGYSEGMSFSLEMSLDQRGQAVYGNYSNSAGDAGNLKGSVEGQVFSGRTESLMLPGNFCDFEAEARQGGVIIQGEFHCSTGDRSRFTLKRR